VLTFIFVTDLQMGLTIIQEVSASQYQPNGTKWHSVHTDMVLGKWPDLKDDDDDSLTTKWVTISTKISGF
jgi:hypothetical protein